MQRDDLARVYQAFLSTPLDVPLGRCKGQTGVELGQWAAGIAREVPAYAQFLAAEGQALESGESPFEFSRLPLMNKDNYLRRFPLAQRCRGGTLEGCDTIAVSSGSTGTPTLWPRHFVHELDIATRFEQIFRDSFDAHQQPTLAVVCFALGTWVGGMFTTACCRLLSQKGYKVLVVTPGNSKTEIFRCVRELSPQFAQTVLLGYPPFIKDIIDSGLAEGVPWPEYRIRMVFAGEVFSEEWRQLVCERAGAGDPRLATASLYGTADAGVIGNETPMSIAIRQQLAKNPALAADIFGEWRLPTLVQYDPYCRYLECIDDTLAVSGENGVPLVRYHIADKGGIFSFQELIDRLSPHIGNPLDLLPTARQVRVLPFAFVFGRADFTVSFFGANIYPENITVGLEQPAVAPWVTGKFIMETAETEDANKQLRVTVELAPGETVDEGKATAIGRSILEALRRLNSEFANYVPASYQSPTIILRTHGDPADFPIGVKHRYTRKTDAL